MPVEYYKRQRMRCEPIAGPGIPAAPPACRWQAWHADHADPYASVLRRAFAQEPDAQLFPSLGSTTGCRMLVRAIADLPGFCPDATWMIEGPAGPAGVILSTVEFGEGMIQNVAVVPEWQDRGLGTALVLRALAGFAAAGIRTVELDVTVVNASAMALYRRLGFRAYKTSYRHVDCPDRSMVGLGI